MNLRTSFLGFIIVLLVFAVSCERPPELAAGPQIQFVSVEFKVVDGGQDSLIVTITFEDDDGDLGLSQDETLPPYNEFFFILEDSSRVYYLNDVTFDDLITFSEAGGDPAFNQNDWFAADFLVDGVAFSDTVRIERNENFNNFFVDFFIKTGNGFEELALIELLGTNFDGRFMVLNPDGIESDRPLEGTLRYTMRSFGFLINPILRNETLKLQLQIQDRQLNRSNIVETPEFKLVELARDG